MQTMEAIIIDSQESASAMIVKYDITDAKIGQMRTEYSLLRIVDGNTYEAVRLAIADVRCRRTAVEKRRKKFKAKALDYGRRVDAEAKRITGLLEEIEEPLKTTKQAEDIKREAIHQEASRKEAERVGTIQKRIDEIKAKVPTTPTDSDRLAELVFEIEDTVIDAGFQELTESAEQVKAETLAKLNQMLFDRLGWETEEKNRKDELVRLEALRIENIKLESERKAKEEAEEKIRQAERGKIEAERKTLEAEKAMIETEKRAGQERKEQEEYLRQEIVRGHIRDRSMMLSGVSCECMPPNLGTISREEFNVIYDEHRESWDCRQEAIRLEAEEQACKERKEFERIAIEKAGRIATEKATREEAERKIKAEAEEVERRRQEVLRPDKEKLLEFAKFFDSLPYPEVGGQQAQLIVDRVSAIIDDIQDFIRKQVQKL